MQLVIYYVLLISGIQAIELLNYKKLYKYFKHKHNNCTSEPSTITQLPISNFQTKQDQPPQPEPPQLPQAQTQPNLLNHLNKMMVVYKLQAKLLFILELVLM